jgi:hypothetical protein
MKPYGTLEASATAAEVAVSLEGGERNVMHSGCAWVEACELELLPGELVRSRLSAPPADVGAWGYCWEFTRQGSVLCLRVSQLG